MLDLNAAACSDLAVASACEWLETNGIGGYASSTISGANTRRYHGLLTAADKPPLGRVSMLAKLEETVEIGGRSIALSANFYPGAVHPTGFEHLTHFRLDPYPIWTFVIDGLTIERSIFMVHGENTTVVRWKLTEVLPPDEHIRLHIQPLLSFRDHHHLRTDQGDFDESYTIGDGRVSMRPSLQFPALEIAHNAFAVEHTGDRFRNFEYPIEQERGFDSHEDLYQPFSLTFDLADEAVVIASDRPRSSGDASRLERNELRRRAELVARSQISRKELWPLVLAADQFIVGRGDGKTVIAGYPWFSDWGRDTMIALPGLCLSTGRPEIAREILAEFSHHISEGMIPNRFPDEGETPDYNTVDATLWYFEAIRAYVEATGDIEFVERSLYKGLCEIIDKHVSGTRFNIRMDPDGLIYAGDAAVQLTWMDAKVGDLVITPRTGKPVEIQALWYNALLTMAAFAEPMGDGERAMQCRELAARARESFNEQFWNEEENSLFDVVDGDRSDASIRPNQIFVVSLHHSILDHARAAVVVDTVERELLTPFGLRTLAPSDPSYVGTYIGSPLERDSAYHQGTVWAWLIGHFVEAYRKANALDPRVEDRVTEILAPLLTHLNQAAIGQVSEIFDADAPHAPRGCPAQAWSVAELLRSCSPR